MTRAQRAAAALLCAAALVGCAVPDPSRGEVGRYKLALPEAGRWTEIAVSEPFQAPLAVAGDAEAMPLRTRAWGLPGPDSVWQAVVLLHVGDARRSTATSWARACPQQRGLLVHDEAGGSPTRIDCLQLRRSVRADNWLARHRPDLMRWTQQRSAGMGDSAALVSHMFTTADGEFLMLDVLANQALVRPDTRGNDAFLRAGLPAQEWSERVAQAVRVASGMVDGHLALPEFPFAFHSSSPITRTSP